MFNFLHIFLIFRVIKVGNCDFFEIKQKLIKFEANLIANYLIISINLVKALFVIFLFVKHTISRALIEKLG